MAGSFNNDFNSDFDTGVGGLPGGGGGSGGGGGIRLRPQRTRKRPYGMWSLDVGDWIQQLTRWHKKSPRLTAQPRRNLGSSGW